MLAVLLVAILTTGAILIALVALVLVTRLRRESAERRRQRRRSVLEPLVLAYAHGAEDTIWAALAGKWSPRDRPVLEEIILDHAQRVRGGAHDRLARAFDDLGLTDRCLAALTARHWHGRATAAEKLGLIAVKRATNRLAAALDDVDPEVRLRAAKALGAVGGPVAVGLLIEALAQPNRWSTIRIGDILARMGWPAGKELIAAFPNLNAAARLTALDILGQLRALEAGTWLVGRLNDAVADVRARACHALGELADPSAGPALVRALRDGEWPVRAMAAKALGRIGWRDATADLSDALRDPQWWVRLNAAEALRQLGEPGFAALLKMLDDQDAFARHQAVAMLQEAGVLDREVDQLAGPPGPGQEAAEALVRRVAGAGQLTRLRELADAHRDPLVRGALARLLPPEPSSAGVRR